MNFIKSSDFLIESVYHTIYIFGDLKVREMQKHPPKRARVTSYDVTLATIGKTHWVMVLFWFKIMYIVQDIMHSQPFL